MRIIMLMRVCVGGGGGGGYCNNIPPVYTNLLALK